jgi:hypothetical protein
MSYRSSEYRGAKSVPEPDQQAAVTRPRRKVFQSYRANRDVIPRPRDSRDLIPTGSAGHYR